MKAKRIFVLSLVCLTSLLHFIDIDARGGGRGGGGGGRGGGGRGGGVGPGGGGRGGGQSISRTPSMSRSVPRQNRPTQRPASSRPSVPQQRPETRRPSSTPRANTGKSREQAKNYLRQSRPPQLSKEALTQKQQAYKANRTQRDRQNKQNANRVQDQFKRNHQDYRDWFDRSFYDRHDFHPPYYNSRVNWWRAASWAGVSSWLAWGWGDPIYYDSSYPIHLTGDDYDYYSTESYNPYYNPSQEYGQTVAPAPADQNQDIEGDWLPLGVYAVGQNEDQAAVSNMFVQLAVRKNGDISGTYYNAATDQTHELDGVVDQDSQQAVWKVTDNPNSPLMATGIYNLTQDETSVVVHFPNGTDQTWIMVRLQE